MGKVDDHARALEALDDPEPYLLEHSGLPGPRGNIELGLAAARVCDATQLRRWAALDARAEPTGGAGEFLAFCGVIGLGRLLAEGDSEALSELVLSPRACGFLTDARRVARAPGGRPRGPRAR